MPSVDLVSTRLIAENSESLIPKDDAVDPIRAPTPGTNAQSGMRSPDRSIGAVIPAFQLEPVLAVVIANEATGSGDLVRSDCGNLDPCIPFEPEVGITFVSPEESPLRTRARRGKLSRLSLGEMIDIDGELSPSAGPAYIDMGIA